MILWGLLACLADLGAASVGAHAGRCGDCHVAHAEAFAPSRHAVAATGPVFRALRTRAATEGLDAFCDGCHAPDGGDGLACATCHGAAGHQRPANGELLMDLTGPVRGPLGAAEAPHASVQEPFLTDAALCATCHEVDGPGAFVESPWRHWRGTEAAARGERCQDCHMSDAPGAPAARPQVPWVAGGPARPVSDHGFVGLQDAPRVLLAAGLELQPVPGGVRLVNHAAHRLPDGAAFTRELWVEGRHDGAWLGGPHPLHPALRDGQGRPTWDPLVAASVEVRALDPEGERTVALDGADEACLRFRPVAEGLARGLGLPVPALQTMHCVALP